MVGDFLEKYKDYFHTLVFTDQSIIMIRFYFPSNWEINEFIIKNQIDFNIESQTSEKILITLISYGQIPLDQKVDKIIKCVDEIIKFNIEKEVKEKLLNERIEELKNFVKNNDIDTITNLKLDIKNGES